MYGWMALLMPAPSFSVPWLRTNWPESEFVPVAARPLMVEATGAIVRVPRPFLIRDMLPLAMPLPPAREELIVRLPTVQMVSGEKVFGK